MFQQLLLIDKLNVIYFLFIIHCIETKFSSCFFDNLLISFSSKSSFQILEIVESILKQLESSKEVEIIDVFLASELSSKLIDISNESNNQFPLALASFFEKFLFSMLTYPNFYNEKLQKISEFLLSHRFFDHFLLPMNQYFTSNYIQTNSLRLKQIIQFLSQIFKKILSFEFQDLPYITLVQILILQLTFGTNLFLKTLKF